MIVRQACAVARAATLASQQEQQRQRSEAEGSGRPTSKSKSAAAAASTPAGCYPPEELEWLATTTFNRAVDAFVASDRAACGRLVEQAVELARHRDDGGRLSGFLLEKSALLRWDGGD